MNPVPWTPAEVGRLTALSPSLSPLTPHLDHVTVVTNLQIEAGAHHRQITRRPTRRS